MCGRVASYADAWIESTSTPNCSRTHCVSHPTRMRGLKVNLTVSPIEIDESHPTRMRGLKAQKFSRRLDQKQSHPTRMRGLKDALGEAEWIEKKVASYADAWIESCKLAQLEC